MNRKSLSFRMMLSLIVVTALVVFITSIVFTFLFENYTTSDKEKTLTTCAQDIARLVSEDEAGSYDYNIRTISDYSLFMQTVLNSSVWIMNSDGVFRKIAEEVTPLHLKELDSTAASAIEKALDGETLLTTDFSAYFGEDMLTALVPVVSTTFSETVRPKVTGVVLVHCTNENVNKTFVFAMNFLIVSIFIAVVFSILAAILISERYTRPLIKMSNAALKMAEGDYSTRTSISEGGEISTLSESLDYLAQTLSTTISALNTEKDKLNDIIDNVSDGLCAFDTDLKSTEYNIAYMKMCSESVMEEHGIFELMRKSMDEHKVNAAVVETEDILKYIASPTYGPDGVTGCVLIVQDISRSERLERTRREFVSDVSHEFRTPLTVIKGYVELLVDGAITEEKDVKRTYSRIEKETSALEKLVTELLDLSRMKAGRVTVDIVKTDLHDIVDVICSNMNTVSAKKNVSVIYNAGNIPFVEGDHDKLRQLFIILIDNAIKFTPEGGTITVSTFVRDGYVCATVRDTGTGISKEDLPYIFERFYKADKSRRQTANSGSGLGLSIASNIVELLHGEITVESELGKGTEFTVMLRIYTEDGEKA